MGSSIVLRSHLSLLLAAVATLSSCTSLPSSGPNPKDVDQQAAVKLVDTRGKGLTVGVDYALVDISADVLRHVGQSGSSSLKGSFGGGRGGAPSLPLGVGDIVSVAIFESQSGGLFVPADAGSRPGNFVTIPNQTISGDGTITVPYAGRIRAVGRPISEVEQQLEDTLANRAIEPQVLINKVTSKAAQASVIGDVNSPTSIELSEAGDRVLDALSKAGGLSTPGIETYVTLQRRGRTATVLYDHLIKTPAENIYVAPGDTLIVSRERRTYLAFGAAGLNGRFDFEDSDLSLGEALAKAGGLLDARADAAQVLLYRVVKRELLSSLGIETSKYMSETVPVIFRANMRNPSALFLMQRFPMQDKDIIYVGNSSSTELLKFLNIVNSVTATASGVSDDVVSTKNNAKEL